MARRAALVKRKPKTIRITKSEAYIVNKKHLGDEPIFTKPLTKLDYMSALNWYNYMCSNLEAKEYIIEYLKNTGRVADAKKYKYVPDSLVPTTVAWICRLLSKGYKLPTDTEEYINSRINESYKYIKETEQEDSKPMVSIQDRMREKAHDILGEIEGLIDDNIHKNEEFSLYTWLQSNNIPAAYATSIITKLSPVLDELLEAYDGQDPQLKEGYRSYKKSEIKRLIDFYNTMCEDAAKYANVTKKTRSPRKPRVQSVEKKLKSFKYQKEDNTFKIASVNPEKIIGSQELWTFNTKYKTLSVFRALDRGGLDVKGTSIVKFDEASSFTLRTGRKPEEVVKKVLDGGKILLRKLDQELKHNATLQSRISESTILLRVVT
jgi:hypothetical protein